MRRAAKEQPIPDGTMCQGKDGYRYRILSNDGRSTPRYKVRRYIEGENPKAKNWRPTVIENFPGYLLVPESELPKRVRDDEEVHFQGRRPD